MTKYEMKLFNKLLDDLRDEYGIHATQSEIIAACGSTHMELRNLGEILAKRRGMQVIET